MNFSEKEAMNDSESMSAQVLRNYVTDVGASDPDKQQKALEAVYNLQKAGGDNAQLAAIMKDEKFKEYVKDYSDKIDKDNQQDKPTVATTEDGGEITGTSISVAMCDPDDLTKCEKRKSKIVFMEGATGEIVVENKDLKSKSAMFARRDAKYLSTPGSIKKEKKMVPCKSMKINANKKEECVPIQDKDGKKVTVEEEMNDGVKISEPKVLIN